MSSKQCVVRMHHHLLKCFLVLFFLQDQCSTTTSFQVQEGRTGSRSRTATAAASSKRMVLCSNTNPSIHPNDSVHQEVFPPCHRREVLRAAGGTAFVGTLLLLPSQARAGTSTATDNSSSSSNNSNENYKDVTTKISSQFLPATDRETDNKEDALASIDWSRPKVKGLTTQQMAHQLEIGLRRECWFVTGRSVPEYFSDTFQFSDPQVTLTGIEEYSRGVRKFYQQHGPAPGVGEVVCLGVTAPHTITVVWRNYGTVQIGPGLYVRMNGSVRRFSAPTTL